MKVFATSVRMGVALVMLMALIGFNQTFASAQESETATSPQADVIQAPLASVAVSCSYDASLNQSSCTFTAVSETGVVDALTVPYAALCAQVLGGSGAAGGVGYSAAGAGGNPSLSLVLQGYVQAGGGASYEIEGGGTTLTAGGAGVVCGQAPEPPLPSELAEEEPATAPSNVESLEATPEVADESDVATEQENTEASEDEAVAEGEEPPVSDEVPVDATPEAVASPVTDGTGDPAAQPAAEAAEDDVSAAAVLTIPITAYNCDTESDAQDPTTLCDPAQGITFEVTEDDQPPIQVFTDSNGQTSVDAEEGSSVLIEELISSVPAGYVSLGGVQTIDPVTAGASATFVHVFVGAGSAGRLQIVNGSCPTSGEARTEFQVIEPQIFTAGAESSCAVTSGAIFTITGPTLPGGTLTVQTGSDGAWRGPLPVGTYTVIDDSGESASIEIFADELTTVIVVDYYTLPEGTLTITRYLCTEGDVEGTTISVAATPGGGGPGCGLSDGDMLLAEVGDGTSGAAEEFPIGPDGQAELDLRVGSYILTDLTSGMAEQVEVTADATTAATVQQVVLTGRALVQHFYCDDPAYRSVNPADYAAFSDGCNLAYAGMPLTLYDGNGGTVGTATGSGGGIIVWSQLLPGAYSVGGGAVCATFAEGADARGGFAVAIGNTTMVDVFSCAPPANDGTGGNNGGTGQPGSGGDGTGGGSPPGLYVSQLPNTGIGKASATGMLLSTGAAVVVLMMAAAGYVATRRRGI